MPFSSRVTTDSIVQMANLLTQWIAQNRPTELFQIMTDATQAPAEGFVLTPQVGAALTNIGSTLCSFEGHGGNQHRHHGSDGRVLLPRATAPFDRLDQTDRRRPWIAGGLAELGIVAYALKYPSVVRRRRQAAVHPWCPAASRFAKFDKATQTFSLPANTRFYKTLLR